MAVNQRRDSQYNWMHRQRSTERLNYSSSVFSPELIWQKLLNVLDQIPRIWVYSWLLRNAPRQESSWLSTFVIHYVDCSRLTVSILSIHFISTHIAETIKLNFRCAIDFDDGRTLLAFFEFFKIFEVGFSGNPGIFRKILIFCIFRWQISNYFDPIPDPRSREPT